MPVIERPLQIVLIRHAESARNKAKKGSTYFANEEDRVGVEGVPDYKIPLSDVGHTQAEKTGVYLKDRFGVPDYFYHSGYLRTMQTQEGILKAFSESERKDINVRMNPFIRERDPGYTYDMTNAEAAKAFPWLQSHWDTFGGYFSRPPGGESLDDVTKRVYLFLNMLFRDRVGQKVWVATHGGTLRTFRFILERWSYDQALKWPKGQTPENCGVTTYNLDKRKGSLVLADYNLVGWR